MTTETPKVRVMERTADGLKPAVKPIVLEYKKETKEKSQDETKPKYSKGLEDIQTIEEDLLRVSQRAARSLSKGIDTYKDERDKSALEKKDGAIEDFIHNSAKAMSASLKEASDIPVDIAESLSRDTTMRKRLRRSLKDASEAIGFWRI